jgi:Raf kinase inhibitor-like YbhB/YbcL family protein
VVRVKTFIILAIGVLVIAGGYGIFTIFARNQNATWEQLLLTSSAFATGTTIPAAYTCDGANVNPPLSLQNIPDGAQSVVIDLVDTSMSQNQANWLIWDVSPEVMQIPQNANASVGDIGVNEAGKNGYAGPCKTVDNKSNEHHYRFEAYALNTILNLPTSANFADVQQAMKKHIVAYGSLTGIY